MSGQNEIRYADKFRDLLKKVEPAKLEMGVQIFLRKMTELEEVEKISREEAFLCTYENAKQRVETMLAKVKECRIQRDQQESKMV